MKCKHCGAEIVEGAPFCYSCGMEVEPESTEDDPVTERDPVAMVSGSDETIQDIPVEPASTDDNASTTKGSIPAEESSAEKLVDPTPVVTSEQNESSSIPEIRFCPSCGEPLVTGASFCSKCGRSINTSSAPEPEGQNSTARRRTQSVRFKEPTNSQTESARNSEPDDAKYIFICPRCGKKYGLKERIIKICSDCNVKIIDTGYTRDVWFRLPSERREEIEERISIENANAPIVTPSSVENYTSSDSSSSVWVGLLRVVTWTFIIAGIIGSFVYAYQTNRLFGAYIRNWFWIGVIGSILTLIIAASIMVFLDIADDVRSIKTELKWQRKR